MIFFLNNCIKDTIPKFYYMGCSVLREVLLVFNHMSSLRELGIGENTKGCIGCNNATLPHWCDFLLISVILNVTKDLIFR